MSKFVQNNDDQLLEVREVINSLKRCNLKAVIEYDLRTTAGIDEMKIFDLRIKGYYTKEEAEL